jgi:acetoin utilization protein AcuB
MLVRERMTLNPITVLPDLSVPDALRLMREKKVRRFPVVDSHGKLVGIVSDKDLLQAGPSAATTLAIWEITELLSKLKVAEVMSREVITVPDDTPLEEAARIMADGRIGGLVIMHGDKVAGIITETDLFKSLLELLGGRRSGVRITVATPGGKGELAHITNAIFNAGGNIVGLAAREIEAGADTHWEVTFKVQDVSVDNLVTALKPVTRAIHDVRQA